MKHNILTDICGFFRNSFFRLVNKEFLIFLFFLALSGAFWLLLALNDTYEKEIRFPIRIVNIPKNVVLTSEMDDTIRVVVRDKGYTLCTYLYGDVIKRIDLPFSWQVIKKVYGMMTTTDLSKLLYHEI